MGRNAVSDEFKRMTGTYRHNRRQRGVYSTPLKKVPRPPSTLSKEGKVFWDTFIRNGMNLGLVCEEDLPAILNLSEMMVTADLLQKQVKTHGAYIRLRGRIEKNPAIAGLLNIQKYIQKTMNDFGFTPKSRQGMARLDPPKPTAKGSGGGMTDV